jgi:hypothetical protein
MTLLAFLPGEIGAADSNWQGGIFCVSDTATALFSIPRHIYYYAGICINRAGYGPHAVFSLSHFLHQLKGGGNVTSIIPRIVASPNRWRRAHTAIAGYTSIFTIRPSANRATVSGPVRYGKADLPNTFIEFVKFVHSLVSLLSCLTQPLQPFPLRKQRPQQPTANMPFIQVSARLAGQVGGTQDLDVNRVVNDQPMDLAPVLDMADGMTAGFALPGAWWWDGWD